jgi:hypothetical protein
VAAGAVNIDHRIGDLLRELAPQVLGTLVRRVDMPRPDKGPLLVGRYRACRNRGADRGRATQRVRAATPMAGAATWTSFAAAASSAALLQRGGRQVPCGHRR